MESNSQQDGNQDSVNQVDNVKSKPPDVQEKKELQEEQDGENSSNVNEVNPALPDNEEVVGEGENKESIEVVVEKLVSKNRDEQSDQSPQSQVTQSEVNANIESNDIVDAPGDSNQIELTNQIQDNTNQSQEERKSMIPGNLNSEHENQQQNITQPNNTISEENHSSNSGQGSESTKVTMKKSESVKEEAKVLSPFPVTQSKTSAQTDNVHGQDSQPNNQTIVTQSSQGDAANANNQNANILVQEGQESSENNQSSTVSPYTNDMMHGDENNQSQEDQDDQEDTENDLDKTMVKESYSDVIIVLEDSKKKKQKDEPKKVKNENDAPKPDIKSQQQNQHENIVPPNSQLLQTNISNTIQASQQPAANQQMQQQIHIQQNQPMKQQQAQQNDQQPPQPQHQQNAQQSNQPVPAQQQQAQQILNQQNQAQQIPPQQQQLPQQQVQQQHQVAQQVNGAQIPLQQSQQQISQHAQQQSVQQISQPQAQPAQALTQSQQQPAKNLQSQDNTTNQDKDAGDDDGSDSGDDDDECAPKEDFIETSPSGRFKRFNEELGKGAYKCVYRGVDHDTGREVAWSIISLSRLPKSERGRIKTEIHLIKNLNHKNIITFINAWICKEREQIHLITEMITGGSLRQYMKKMGKPKLKVIKKWCNEILDGLKYLHSQAIPIIHRDIKCDNIFINSNSGEIKIGDLGLSTSMKGSQTNTVLGTPEFMAPELYEECYGIEVDIYAFGMALLEMLTREPPYRECINPAQIYKKVIGNKLPNSLERIQDPQVKSFILMCIKSEKKERPTAQQLLESEFLQDTTNINNDSPCNVLDLKKPVKPKVQKQKIPLAEIPEGDEANAEDMEIKRENKQQPQEQEQQNFNQNLQVLAQPSDNTQQQQNVAPNQVQPNPQNVPPPAVDVQNEDQPQEKSTAVVERKASDDQPKENGAEQQPQALAVRSEQQQDSNSIAKQRVQEGQPNQDEPSQRVNLPQDVKSNVTSDIHSVAPSHMQPQAQPNFQNNQAQSNVHQNLPPIQNYIQNEDSKMLKGVPLASDTSSVLSNTALQNSNSAEDPNAQGQISNNSPVPKVDECTNNQTMSQCESMMQNNLNDQSVHSNITAPMQLHTATQQLQEAFYYEEGDEDKKSQQEKLNETVSYLTHLNDIKMHRMNSTVGDQNQDDEQSNQEEDNNIEPNTQIFQELYVEQEQADEENNLFHDPNNIQFSNQHDGEPQTSPNVPQQGKLNNGLVQSVPDEPDASFFEHQKQNKRLTETKDSSQKKQEAAPKPNKDKQGTVNKQPLEQLQEDIEYEKQQKLKSEKEQLKQSINNQFKNKSMAKTSDEKKVQEPNKQNVSKNEQQNVASNSKDTKQTKASEKNTDVSSPDTKQSKQAILQKPRKPNDPPPLVAPQQEKKDNVRKSQVSQSVPIDQSLQKLQEKAHTSKQDKGDKTPVQQAPQKNGDKVAKQHQHKGQKNAEQPEQVHVQPQDSAPADRPAHQQPPKHLINNNIQKRITKQDLPRLVKHFQEDDSETKPKDTIMAGGQNIKSSKAGTNLDLAKLTGKGKHKEQPEVLSPASQKSVELKGKKPTDRDKPSSKQTQVQKPKDPEKVQNAENKGKQNQQEHTQNNKLQTSSKKEEKKNTKPVQIDNKDANPVNTTEKKYEKEKHPKENPNTVQHSEKQDQANKGSNQNLNQHVHKVKEKELPPQADKVLNSDKTSKQKVAPAPADAAHREHAQNDKLQLSSKKDDKKIQKPVQGDQAANEGKSQTPGTAADKKHEKKHHKENLNASKHDDQKAEQAKGGGKQQKQEATPSNQNQPKTQQQQQPHAKQQQQTQKLNIERIPMQVKLGDEIISFEYNLKKDTPEVVAKDLMRQESRNHQYDKMDIQTFKEGITKQLERHNLLDKLEKKQQVKKAPTPQQPAPSGNQNQVKSEQHEKPPKDAPSSQPEVSQAQQNKQHRTQKHVDPNELAASQQKKTEPNQSAPDQKHRDKDTVKPAKTQTQNQEKTNQNQQPIKKQNTVPNLGASTAAGMGGTGSIPVQPQDQLEEVKQSSRVESSQEGQHLKQLYKSMNEAIRKFYQETQKQNLEVESALDRMNYDYDRYGSEKRKYQARYITECQKVYQEFLSHPHKHGHGHKDKHKPEDHKHKGEDQRQKGGDNQELAKSGHDKQFASKIATTKISQQQSQPVPPSKPLVTGQSQQPQDSNTQTQIVDKQNQGGQNASTALKVTKSVPVQQTQSLAAPAKQQQQNEKQQNPVEKKPSKESTANANSAQQTKSRGASPEFTYVFNIQRRQQQPRKSQAVDTSQVFMLNDQSNIVSPGDQNKKENTSFSKLQYQDSEKEKNPSNKAQQLKLHKDYKEDKDLKDQQNKEQKDHKENKDKDKTEYKDQYNSQSNDKQANPLKKQASLKLAKNSIRSNKSSFLNLLDSSVQSDNVQKHNSVNEKSQFFYKQEQDYIEYSQEQNQQQSPDRFSKLELNPKQ